MVDGRHSTRRAVKEGQASLVSKADADAATSPPRIKNVKPRQARKVSTAAGVSKSTKQNRKVSVAAKKIANAAQVDEPLPPLPVTGVSAAWCHGPDYNAPPNRVVTSTAESGVTNLLDEHVLPQARPAGPAREHLTTEEVERIRARVKDELAADRISPVRHGYVPNQPSSSLVLPRPIHPEPPPPGIAPVSPYLRAIGRTPSPQPPSRLANIPPVPPIRREDVFQSLDAPAPPLNAALQESTNTDQDDLASLFEEEALVSQAAADIQPGASKAPPPSQPAPAPAPSRPSLALPKLSPPPEPAGHVSFVLGVNDPKVHHTLPGLGRNTPAIWDFSSLNPPAPRSETSPTDPALRRSSLANNNHTAEEPADPEDDRSRIAIDGHSERNSMAITWGDEDEELEVDARSHQGRYDSVAQPSPITDAKSAAKVNRPGPEPHCSFRSSEQNNDEYREHDDSGSPIIYSDEDGDEAHSYDIHPADQGNFGPATTTPYHPAEPGIGATTL